MTYLDDDEKSEHDLLSFQKNEKRFIYGRLLGDSGLWRLEHGRASELRQWVKDYVRCPVPGCAAPELTTVRREGGVDGLRHLRAGGEGHSVESLFHIQANALIEDWAKRRFPTAGVKREERTESGERRADVMLTSSDGAVKIAFEIQYSPLTPDEWRTRHKSYAREGIADIWLFGHTRHQLKIDRNSGVPKISPLHAAVLKAGLPLLWINPIEQSILLCLGRIGAAGDAVGYEGFPPHQVVPPRSFSLESFTVKMDGRMVNDWMLNTANELSRLRDLLGLRTNPIEMERAPAASFTAYAARRLAQSDDPESWVVRPTKDRDFYLQLPLRVGHEPIQGSKKKMLEIGCNEDELRLASWKGTSHPKQIDTYRVIIQGLPDPTDTDLCDYLDTRRQSSDGDFLIEDYPGVGDGPFRVLRERMQVFLESIDPNGSYDKSCTTEDGGDYYGWDDDEAESFWYAVNSD